jgi:sigma-B regulation protein RsbU (phosphoserine phosphatase)
VPLPDSSLPAGVVTLGIDAYQWLDWVAVITASPVHFFISILDSSGNVFVSQNPDLNLSKTWVFSIPSVFDAEELFQEVMETGNGKAYLRFFGQENRRIGVKIPVKSTSFFLMLDSSQQVVSFAPSSKVTSTLMNIVFIFLIIGSGMAIIITFRISRPLNSLYRVMQQVAAGDFSARYHQDRVGFEINVIGHTFNHMIDSVLHHMEEARTEKLFREVLSQELKIGHDIQRSILPKETPHFPDIDIATGFQGAKEVAGDFYDLFLRSESELVCAVADAAGKGISACLYSLCVRSMLRSFESTSESLAEMLRKTNNLFCKDTAETGNFVTAWVGILNSRTKQLEFASCGHLPGLLKRRDGRIEELTTSGIALGIMPLHQSEPSSTTTLAQGDLLLLYTDGLIDSQDAYFEFFGKQRLIDTVKEIPASFTAQESIEYILERLTAFTQSTPITDDRTLLLVKIV